jgi:hypothetical protein
LLNYLALFLNHLLTISPDFLIFLNHFLTISLSLPPVACEELFKLENIEVGRCTLNQVDP